MTVKQQFLLVQNDVIRNLDSRFVEYLDETLPVKYSGNYPQKYEELLLLGTYNSEIKVGNLRYEAYSDEFFKLIENEFDREYLVKFSFVHNYCFEMFCVYFEFLSVRTTYKTANAYFDDFKFFLDIQINTNNKEYNESYSRYWQEIISRIMNALKNGGYDFYNRFTEEQRQSAIDQLSFAENALILYTD